MNKEILISIKPEHAFNILNGDKTLEIRKSVPKDFVGWVYIYVTKGKPYITQQSSSQFTIRESKDFTNLINGKVVARFWLDEIAIFNYIDIAIPNGYEDFDGEWVDTTNHEMCYWIKRQELNAACVECENDLEEYGQGKTLYAWHIKKLEIFNKPKDLWDFHTRHDMLFLGRTMAKKVFQFESVNKAPQSWQYVWRKE